MVTKKVISKPAATERTDCEEAEGEGVPYILGAAVRKNPRGLRGFWSAVTRHRFGGLADLSAR
jgi:hypothetical protein